MKTQIPVIIKIPMTPNYIGVLFSKEANHYPIEDFTDEQLEKIAEQWTKDWIAKAQERRKLKENNVEDKSEKNIADEIHGHSPSAMRL